MKVVWTRISRNAKTGPMPVSTVEKASCPAACPLKNNGCYAEQGPIGWFWNKVGTHPKALDWDGYCAEVSRLPLDTLWRHAQAGDLPGQDNRIDQDKLKALVKANHGKRGFGYTHYPITEENLAVLREANEGRFTMNLSADGLADADRKAATGLPTVAVVPADQRANTVTPEGRKVVICPAVTRGITCLECGLCQRQNHPIVGFPAHGARWKTVQSTIQQYVQSIIQQQQEVQ